MFLLFTFVYSIYLFEKTNKGFLGIINSELALTSVYDATDFFIENCIKSKFGIKFIDSKSLKTLTFSKLKERLITTNNIFNSNEECFRLTLTPNNDFVIVYRNKCLRNDNRKNSPFYFVECNKNPSFFKIIFETSVMKGEEIPRYNKYRRSPYRELVNNKIHPSIDPHFR